MTLQAGDVRIDCVVMDHARGAWAGMRPQWYTATHVATGFSVRWHEWCDGSRGQHRDRESALACLDLMIEQMQPRALPLDFNSTPKEGD
jgi:hypothetical protein